MQPFTAIYVKMVFESYLEGITNHELMSFQLQEYNDNIPIKGTLNIL